MFHVKHFGLAWAAGAGRKAYGTCGRREAEGRVELVYTVKELADLAGVSVRTLHHYDELGLVCAQRAKNGYRLYDETAVDRLHQVLLFREAGMPLADIRRMMDEPQYEQAAALKEHLRTLREKRSRIDGMIANVEATLTCLEEGEKMADSEKFAAFKREAIAKSEGRYGAEAREKWGDEAVDTGNAKLMGMTEEQWRSVQDVEARLREHLLAAMRKADPFCEDACQAAKLHKQWLCSFWKEGTYTPQAHIGLAQMYVADDRFKAYYDQWTPGTAEFLRDAIEANVG